MIDWIVETLGLLFRGLDLLLVAVIRLGLLFIVMVFIGSLIRDAMKNPKKSFAFAFFFIAAISIGFAIPLLAIYFSDSGLVLTISAFAGLAACMKTISLGERFCGEDSKSA